MLYPLVTKTPDLPEVPISTLLTAASVLHVLSVTRSAFVCCPWLVVAAGITVCGAFCLPKSVLKLGFNQGRRTDRGGAA